MWLAFEELLDYPGFFARHRHVYAEFSAGA
jgi:hypothetical protein